MSSKRRTDRNCTDILHEGSDDEGSTETTLRFTIKSASGLWRAESGPVYLKSLPWTILALRKSRHQTSQTQLSNQKDSFAFFIRCNSESRSTNWSCNAIAELRIISQKEDCDSIFRRVHHVFYSSENDWGFDDFLPWQQLIDPSGGLVKNDAIILEAWIKVDAPFGFIWSRKETTGFVGLKDQTASSNAQNYRLSALNKITTFDHHGNQQDHIGHESANEATFRFVIDNIKNLKEGILSPPVFIKNLPWRIEATRTTKRVASKSKMTKREKPVNEGRKIRMKHYLSYFLQCNGRSKKTDWSCKAVAELRIIPQKGGCQPFSRSIQHRFHSEENDWGFSRYISWSELMDPQKGFVKDDSIILEVWFQAYAVRGFYRN